MRVGRRLLLVLALAASGLGLAGCGGPFGWTRATLNRPLHPADVAFIVPRETTWSEVTERLGAPDDLVRTGDGVAADYVSRDSRSFSINFGWPLNFVAPVSYAPHDLVLGGRGVGNRTFEVAFDAHGIVTYAGFVSDAAASQYRLWPFSSPSP